MGEQYFGLLSFDLGMKLKVKVDGKLDDWKKLNSKLVYKLFKKLKVLIIISDEGYLYLYVSVKELEN